MRIIWDTSGPYWLLPLLIVGVALFVWLAWQEHRDGNR